MTVHQALPETYDTMLNSSQAQHRIILDPKAYKHFKDASWDELVHGTVIPVKDPP